MAKIWCCCCSCGDWCLLFTYQAINNITVIRTTNYQHRRKVSWWGCMTIWHRKHWLLRNLKGDFFQLLLCRVSVECRVFCDLVMLCASSTTLQVYTNLWTKRFILYKCRENQSLGQTGRHPGQVAGRPVSQYGVQSADGSVSEWVSLDQSAVSQ